MNSQTNAQRPVWFVDVDGVLNSWEMPGRKHPGYERIEVEIDGVQYPIIYSPAVIARVGSLHRSGRVELVWLTTWLGAAAERLAPALGLPPLGVLARDPALDERPSRTGTWWKQAAAVAELSATQAATFVWTDDDLSRGVKDTSVPVSPPLRG